MAKSKIKNPVSVYYFPGFGTDNRRHTAYLTIRNIKDYPNYETQCSLNIGSPENSYEIYFDLKTLTYIFGEALLNCITEVIDSTFEFDNIYDIDDPLVSHIVNAIKGYRYFGKDKKKIVVHTKIKVSNIPSGISIKVAISCGFINRETENFRLYPFYALYNEIPDRIEMSNKEVIEMMSFINVKN